MSSKLPRHVAIIMDGNGRWARGRKLPRHAGHKAGVDTVQNIVRICSKKGIEALTLFAFSSENWRRPKKEVGLLMELFFTALRRHVAELHGRNVRLKFIGERSALSDRLRETIADGEHLTRNNDGLNLFIAANYGGRWDIVQAVRKLAGEVAKGTLEVSAIDDDLIQRNLSLAGLPEPDLFIRTGGETRISNFLLWQLAYTELYFTPVLWPEFDQAAFDDALQAFAGRQRRFGRTGEQVMHREYEVSPEPCPDGVGSA